MTSYEFFISLRYLRARRKQVFVSIITFISIAGIFLGVAALIIVLAVMNGFETDLRNKILGINSHIILMEYSGVMRNHPRVMREVAQVPGVVAATPLHLQPGDAEKREQRYRHRSPGSLDGGRPEGHQLGQDPGGQARRSRQQEGKDPRSEAGTRRPPWDPHRPRAREEPRGFSPRNGLRRLPPPASPRRWGWSRG